LFLLFLIAGAASATTYTFQDLGVVGSGTQSYGYGMNDNGQVVGISGTGGTANNAAIYSGGTFSYLNKGSYRDCIAYGISDNGAVAGSVDIKTGINPAQQNPCVWTSSGTLTYIGNLGGATGNGYSYCVDNSGQVVGVSATASGSHAFLWTATGGDVDLGAGNARWIDPVTGQIVGGGTAGYPCFFSSSSPGTETVLGNMPGAGGAAYCVNDSGQVVGTYTDTATHAFLWTSAGGGTTIDISAALPLDAFSIAYSINNNGDAVGEYRLSDGVTLHAFEYDSSTSTGIDLNNATFTGAGLGGFVLQQARAINASGQISGFGVTAGGATHAFLLTPVPVPEPSTLLLVATGMLGLLAYAWRKRE
jgi:probable HAF family extracellular repeat protein